jgi:5-methyltetrahydrofolate--homocysteine methyltransferase
LLIKGGYKMVELKDIMGAVMAGNIAETKDAVRLALGKGITPMDIIDKGMVAGLDIIGERFAAGETFLPEMMLSAITAREGIAIATEGLEKGQYKPKATMVLGTVKGDLHDIGKNLITLILRSRGFEVIDLGVDIHKEQFISAIREHKPEILGMSCLMTATMIGMKDVISALKETGLRNTVKVIVGGCPVSHEFASQIGADYYSRDAGSTAVLLEKLLTETKG